MAVAICQRLRRSRETWERVDYLVRNHLRLVQAPEMRLVDAEADARARTASTSCCGWRGSTRWRRAGDLQFVLFCERRRAELGGEALRPPRLLGGDDLIALGYPPGPRIGEILRALEEAQLEGTVATREARRRSCGTCAPLVPEPNHHPGIVQPRSPEATRGART